MAVKRALLIAALAASTLCARKRDDPPTQDDMRSGCVSATEIHSRTFSRGHRIEASVTNHCAYPIEVFFRIAYFDNKEEQFGDGIDGFVLAPYASRRLLHTTGDPNEGRWLRSYKSATIIELTAGRAQ